MAFMAVIMGLGLLFTYFGGPGRVLTPFQGMLFVDVGLGPFRAKPYLKVHGT